MRLYYPSLLRDEFTVAIITAAAATIIATDFLLGLQRVSLTQGLHLGQAVQELHHHLQQMAITINYSTAAVIIIVVMWHSSSELHYFVM